MDDLYSYYDFMLHIGKINRSTIVNIVYKEYYELFTKVSESNGFCKYLSNQIMDSLRKNQIKSWILDLKTIVGIDHVALISEYKEGGEVKKILIDPTFVQFVKKDDQKLIKLKQWPSELMNPKYVKELLTTGVLDIDDDIFNEYLNAFTDKHVNIGLNEWLFSQKMESTSLSK